LNLYGPVLPFPALSNSPHSRMPPVCDIRRSAACANSCRPSSARPNPGEIRSQTYALRRPEISTWHASKRYWTRTILPPRCWSRPFTPKLTNILQGIRLLI
jgi:hypothetical protein